MLVFTYTANPLRLLDLSARAQAPGLRLTALVDQRLESAFAPHRSHFDRVYHVPVEYAHHCFVGAFGTTALDAVTAEARRSPDLRLLSFFEGDIESTAALRDRFGLPGTTAAEARRCRDKLVMKEAVRERGHSVPDAVGLDFSTDPVELFAVCESRLGLPFLIKPVCLGGSLGVSRVRCYRDFEDCARGRMDTGYFAEQEIRGELMHLDLVIDDDGPAWFGCSEYNRPTLDFGAGRPVGSMPVLPSHPRHGEWRDYAVDIAEALGVRAGLVHIEVIRTAEGVCFIEAAGRASGGLVTTVYRKMFGYNMIQAEFSRCLGLSYRPDPPDGLAHFWAMLSDRSDVPRRLDERGIPSTILPASAGPQVPGSLIGRYDTLLASHPDHDRLRDAFAAVV